MIRNWLHDWPLRSTRAALLALAAASIGWPAGAEAATGRLHLDVGGQRRSATVVEHERLKRAPRTTIIVLHGSARKNVRGAPVAGRAAQRSLGLDDQVRNAGVLLVYPDGLEGQWSVEPGGKTNDVAFIRALAARLVSGGLADRRKIFVAGISSGGMMALRIGCEGADFIAGAVALLSAMTTKEAEACKPARPIAAMLLSGTADPLVPFGGGTTQLPRLKEEVVSAEASLAPFAQAASCSDRPHARHTLPDRDPRDGSRVTVERYAGCRTLIELVRVDGGGHTLPGRPSRSDRGVPVGAQNNDANAARLVSDFVRRASR